MLPSSAAEEVMAWYYRLRMRIAATAGSGMLAVSDNK
jgi:hypothetical protein